MHVGGVEVVLLVTGRRGQDDVGEEPRGVHAEVDGDHQVELPVRGVVAPDDLLRLDLAHAAEVLAEPPVPQIGRWYGRGRVCQYGSISVVAASLQSISNTISTQCHT